MTTGSFPPNNIATASSLSEKSPHPSCHSFVDVELGSTQRAAPTKQPSRLWYCTARPWIQLTMVLAAIAIVVTTIVTLVLTKPITGKVHEATLVARVPLPIATVAPGLHGIDFSLPFDDEALEEFAHRPQVGGWRRRAKDGGETTATAVAVAVAVQRRHKVRTTRTVPFANGTAPHVNVTKTMLNSASDALLDVDTQANSDGGPVGSSATLVGGIIGGVVGFIVLSVLLCMCCGGRR